MEMQNVLKLRPAAGLELGRTSIVHSKTQYNLHMKWDKLHGTQDVIT